MKKLITLFLFFSVSLISVSQPVIKSSSHMARAGDIVVKQQVEYKEPGRAGANVLWDFSKLSEVNPEYRLNYIEPFEGEEVYIMGKDTFPMKGIDNPDDLIVGIEHYTRYYYRLCGDTLFCLGHENSVTNLHYTTPLLQGVFSTGFQQQVSLPYESKGFYSMRIPLKISGVVNLEQDAYGMMLLPSGDTLHHVSRMKMVRTIIDEMEQENSESGPSYEEQETYRWYAKGYRYPVFETIHSYYVKEDKRQPNFTTAFFYPLEEAYYNEEYEEESDGDPDNPWEGLSYNIYPNPVRGSYIDIELYLPKEANVHIQLNSQVGMPLIKKEVGFCSAGIHSFQLDIAALFTGNYILNVFLDDSFLIDEVIMKF